MLVATEPSTILLNLSAGVHTQNVESYWNHSKMKLKRMRGCAAKEVPSYLNEFMWRERFGKTSREAMDPLSVTFLSNTLSDFPRSSVLFFLSALFKVTTLSPTDLQMDKCCTWDK